MATKKTSFVNHSQEELGKLVGDKREELKALRFSASGSKNRNVKQARNIRKTIARALTEATARKNTPAA